MFGLLQPWWLIALGVIPLIRWLHRRQAPLSTHTVSAIFLWQVETTEDAPGRVQRPPDPAWRRRALIAALIIAALTAPTVEREHTTLTVWLDDSLSMLTVEDGETRIVAGRRQLDEELQSNNYDEIIRYSLSEAFPRKLDENSTHWLVTDGASERVWELADKVHIDRVIQMGVLTENVAISRLAARRNPDDDGVVDILVTVSNTGNENATRRLKLLRGEQELQTTIVSIQPRQTIYWQTQIPAHADAITASLDRGDALVDDDQLTIPADAQKRLETTVDGQCGQALRSAIATHPALIIVDDDSATDLEVTCPRETFPDIDASKRSVGRIRVLAGAASVGAASVGAASVGAASRRDNRGQRPLPQSRRDSTPVWLPHELSTGRLHLPPEFIASAAWPGRIDTTRQCVLLQSGDLPLIAVTQNADATTVTVDTVINMRHAEFVRQPEYAALMAILVDVAAGRQLLDATMSESRAVAESVIRPGTISGRDAPPTADAPPTERSLWERRPAAKQVPLSWLFILIAMLVLALDIALLISARKRAAHA